MINDISDHLNLNSFMPNILDIIYDMNTAFENMCGNSNMSFWT